MDAVPSGHTCCHSYGLTWLGNCRAQQESSSTRYISPQAVLVEVTEQLGRGKVANFFLAGLLSLLYF